MLSRSEILKLFYLICVDGAYDEIPVSKHPGPNALYIDTTLRAHQNLWGIDSASLIAKSNYERMWGLDTTALMVAAEHGRVFIIGYLLNWGADASLKNHEGRTALEIAMDSPGNLGAYFKIGNDGRDNICAILARHTKLDTNKAYDILHTAAKKNLDYTYQTILNCNPLLQQRLNKLFKSQKRKNHNADLKQFILDNTYFSIHDKLDTSNIKTIFSRRKHKFG